MAAQREDFRTDELEKDDELEKVIAKLKKDKEELEKKVKKLQDEKSMHESEIKDLKLENEELTNQIKDLQIQSRKYKDEKREMIEEHESKIKSYENMMKDISPKKDKEELEKKVKKLQDEKIMHESKIKSYENMMKDISPKPRNEKKIPTYIIRRKYKYPYFIIRSTNYHDALEESKRIYPNLEEVYTVNYDHEETYSSSRLEKELKNIKIFNNEILLVNYTEQKFVEDLNIFSQINQNGCHTFSLIKKEEYLYYASRVRNERLKKTNKKFESKFPDSVKIYTLSDNPNSVTLHIRIKEEFPELVFNNNIKLPNTKTEEEFIREVKRIAEPSLSP